MEIYTVSLFGHREVNKPIEIEAKLETLVKELISSKEYVDFLVGRDGGFDIMAASTIHRIRKEMDYGNASLTLVLPYMTAEYKNNEKSFNNYYDYVEICEKSAGSHYKAAFQVRNKYMTDRSDMVIFYVERNKGGAFQTKKYAEKSGKFFVNLHSMA